MARKKREKNLNAKGEELSTVVIFHFKHHKKHFC